MKIIVAVKRVIDYNVKIRINTERTGIETQNVKMSMNPFDAIAVEAAVRLKEAGIANEIVAVSLGTSASQETLRHTLALGADRAILVETAQELQPLAVAKLLQTLIQQEQPHLVLLGKQAIDDDYNQTGQLLAGMLNWPQGTFVSQLTIENQRVIVIREIDGGLETLALTLPAVITTDLRLNEPRYASLPNIMRAKQKPINIITPENLNVDIQPRIKTIKVTAPSPRKAGIKLNTVTELIEKLKNEAKELSNY